MILVKFKGEVNGVTEVICHHITPEMQNCKGGMTIHFTKLRKWIVTPSKIKEICSSGLSDPLHDNDGLEYDFLHPKN